MTTPSSHPHEIWGDVVKAIAITAVVLGHALPGSSSLSRFIYLFHLPLFFMIAGYYFDFDKYADNSELLIKNSAKRLLLPCVVMSFVAYDIEFWMNSRILSFFYGAGKAVVWHLGMFDFTIAPIVMMMWFLYCLFAVRMILWLFLKSTRFLHLPVYVNLLLALALGIGGLAVGKWKALPWNIDIALAGIWFAYIGILLKQYHFWQWNKKIHLFVVVLCIVIGSIDFRYAQLYFNDRVYVHPMLALLGAAVLCILAFYVTRGIASIGKYKYGKWILMLGAYIGCNSLLIMFLHLLLPEFTNPWCETFIRLAICLIFVEVLARVPVINNVFHVISLQEILKTKPR